MVRSLLVGSGLTLRRRLGLGVPFEPGTPLQDEGLPLLEQVSVDIPQECQHEPVFAATVRVSLAGLQDVVVFPKKNGGQEVNHRSSHLLRCLWLLLPRILLQHLLHK